MGVAEQGLNGRCELQRLHPGNETENDGDAANEDKDDAEAEGEDGGPMVPFRVPGTARAIGRTTTAN